MKRDNSREKKITVCIIEDSAEIRDRIVKTISTSSEFSCLPAFWNGESAWEGLPALNPDIVLTDIRLHGMNSIECIRGLKEKCPHTQFLMFAIQEDCEQVFFDVMSAGANGYLLEKTPQDQMLSTLKKLYESDGHEIAQIARKVVNVFRCLEKEEMAVTGLSAREKEVLQLLSKGFFYKEIADKLCISTGTIRQHIHHIYTKLHVQNRTEALNKCYGRE